MFRDRVKEMAVNHPDMKASEILANVEMLMDNPGYNKFMKVHYRPIFEMSMLGSYTPISQFSPLVEHSHFLSHTTYPFFHSLDTCGAKAEPN